MRVEGTLDVFALPDLFHLVAYARKAGVLEVRSQGRGGFVRFVDGHICAAESTPAGLGLARRLVGSGVIADVHLLAPR